MVRIQTLPLQKSEAFVWPKFMNTEKIMNILFGSLIWFTIAVPTGIMLGIFLKKTEEKSREIYKTKNADEYEWENENGQAILDAKAKKMAA